MRKIRRVGLVLVIACIVIAAVAVLTGCGASTEKLTLDTSAAKTVFAVGETFTSEGLKVTAEMSDGATKDVKLSDCTVSSPDMTTAGRKTVTVSYDGKNAGYEITVSAASEGLPDYFQFTGCHDGLKAQYAIFEFLLILENDYTGTVYQGTLSTLSGKIDKINVMEIPLTWTISKDRDGVVAMEVKIESAEHTFYQESDKSFKFRYNFAFNNGANHRDVDLVGKAEKTYASVDAWKTAMVAKHADEGGDPTDPEEPKKTVTYLFKGGEVKKTDGTAVSNCGAEVSLYNDETAYARTGYAAGGTIHATYQEQTGTWTEADGVITVILDGETYTVALADNTYSFTWKVTSPTDGKLTALVSAAKA